MKKTITTIDDCYIGSSIERSEDDTLISGKGQFGDDIGHPPGTLHVAVLRSSYASGKIVNIDTSGALAIPGVHSIIDGKMFAEISSSELFRGCLRVSRRVRRARENGPAFLPSALVTPTTDRSNFVDVSMLVVVIRHPDALSRRQKFFREI